MRRKLAALGVLGSRRSRSKARPAPRRRTSTSPFTKARRCRSRSRPTAARSPSICRAASGRCRPLAAPPRASPISSTTRGSRRGRPTANGSPSSPIATAATTSGRSRRTASHQHKLTWGAVRRSRAGLVARRHARRLLLRPRQSARQRLQHLDARPEERRAEAAHQGSGRRLHAELVARRQGDRLRVDARGRQSVWAVNVADGTERKVATRRRARVDAPSWGPRRPDRLSRTTAAAARTGVQEASRYEIDGKPITGGENVFAFRASWASPTTSTTCRTARSASAIVDGGAPQTIEFTATLQVTRAPTATRARKRDFTSTTPRQALGIVAAGDLARRQADRVRRARRHLRHAGRRQAGEHHQRRGARHRSGVVAGRLAARLLVGQGQRASAVVDPRHEDGPAAASPI